MPNFIFALLGQAPAGAPTANPIAGFLPIAIIFLIFYMLLIRPQQKKQQQHQKMLSEIKKNDEVVTAGGIHGTVVNVDERTVTLRIDDNTRIRLQKSSVAYVKKK